MKIILSLLLVAVIGAAVYFLRPRLPIMTGYASKVMCSCVFVGGREADNVKKAELDFFPIKYVSLEIDRDKKAVRASVFGLAGNVSAFREGKGCALLSPGTAPSDELSLCKLPPESTLAVSKQQPGVDYARLNKALGLAFEENTPGKKKNTRSVVVLRGGQLIAEKYADGLTGDTPVMAWSMAKSVMNALAGIMVRKNLIRVTDAVPVAEWQQDNRRNITWHNLLQMNSGLDWNEEYGSVSDATHMLYKTTNVYAYAAAKPAADGPGKKWCYSSGTTNILSGAMRQVIGNDSVYHAFPEKELFAKLGIGAVLESDAAGNWIGSSYCMTSSRSWALLGQLYLQDGVWNGERLLPEGWVKYSVTPASGSEGIYGAHVWLNDYNEKSLPEYRMPDAPRDMLYFRGFQGQRVFILPSYDLVVVRTGVTGTDQFDFNEFLKSITDCLPPPDLRQLEKNLASRQAGTN